MLGATAACAYTPDDPRQPPLCDPGTPPARLVRYLSPQVDDGLSASYGLVVAARDGAPQRVFNLSAWQRDRRAGSDRDVAAVPLREALGWARARWDAMRAAARAQQAGMPKAAGGAAPAPPPDDDARYTETLLPEDLGHRLCAPVLAPEAALLRGDAISIGVDPDPAARAGEAGGGELFFSPRIVEPSGAYRPLRPEPRVGLLDYGVTLGFVVLEDLDLEALPPEEELDARLAYFGANGFTDREPLLRRARLRGGSDGFSEARSQPGFLPIGPWLVHGAELRPFPPQCQRPLALLLEVDERDGRRSLRQRSDSSAMRLRPRALLERLGRLARERVREEGAPQVETWFRGERWRFPIAKRVGAAPLAPRGVPRTQLVLPRASLVLTATPSGVAFDAPPLLPLLGRALLHARGPAAQAIADARATRERRGYLADGDVVRSRVSGLGQQRIAVQWRRDPAPAHPGPADPCSRGAGAP